MFIMMTMTRSTVFCIFFHLMHVVSVCVCEREEESDNLIDKPQFVHYKYMSNFFAIAFQKCDE